MPETVQRPTPGPMMSALLSGQPSGGGDNPPYPAYGAQNGGNGGAHQYPYGPPSFSPLPVTSSYGNPALSGYKQGNGPARAPIPNNGALAYGSPPAPAPYSQTPSSYAQLLAAVPSAHASPAQPTAPFAAYAPSGGTSPSHSLRNTRMYGQTLTNWQPALPVSPWASVDRSPVIGGGVETETILRSDLEQLKRSRFKGWLSFTALLGLAATAGYFAMGDRQRLVRETNDAKDKHARLEKVHQETVRAASQAATAADATRVGAPATAAGAVTSPATLKLADDLKRTMAGAPQLSIETRGDRVVVGLETAVLFSGRETDVGVRGYRTLFRFGKSVKTVKDRRISIIVPSVEMKRVKSVWALAAGRGVSLGRFFTDDLGFEHGRVTISVPAPKAGNRALSGKLAARVPQGRVEFVLESI